jgi:hypothetical protein
MKGVGTFRGIRRWLWVGVWVCVVGAGCCWSQGQDEAQDRAVDDDSAHTLHVYENTIQIPVLVLGPGRQEMPRVSSNRFSVSVDSGPWFRASHVRLEGDDPISLSILLDGRGDQREMLAKIDAVMQDLGPELREHDDVSIYLTDCSVLQVSKHVLGDAASLKQGVDGVLALQAQHRAEEKSGRCRIEGRLWDTLAYMVAQLYEAPGRRVIFVVTNGLDTASKRTWNETRGLAAAAGVAVFGAEWSPIARELMAKRFDSEAPFRSVCELTGGMVEWTTTDSLESTLVDFVRRVRDRYIVEFPRPHRVTAGAHNLEVKIDGAPAAVIHSAGISVPMPDAAEISDPNTVQGDPTKTPEMGNRKILDPR